MSLREPGATTNDASEMDFMPGANSTDVQVRGVRI
ncbi:hypothetical protein BKA01_007003 [Pseudonocardia eucalypti]|nr:hypothetical protein [Pseudonocardia eucalypti]